MTHDARSLLRLLPAALCCLGACAGIPRAPSPSRARLMVAGQPPIPVVDLIIVHGCPARPDGAPSTCNQRRVRAAIKAYREGLAPRVLFTGGAVVNRFPESRVMAAYARQQGLPDEAILAEEESHHTVTNLSLAKGIMKRLGMRTALQVSESLHLVWAKQLAEFYGMQTWLYPADMLPPYTSAYENAQEWDAYEPWKTQTGAYGKPLAVVAHAAPPAGPRVAWIVVGERAALTAMRAAPLFEVPAVEVQRFEWSADRPPAESAEELSLWVRGWARGFNGPVDEVVVLFVGGASVLRTPLEDRVPDRGVPLRFALAAADRSARSTATGATASP